MITNKIQEFAEWTKHNFITMITILVCFMLCFLAIVMFSWLFGFWANAYIGKQVFELGSCWQGITVVVTGLGGVAALAKAGLNKYSTDSQYNSEEGKHPYEQIANKAQEVISSIKKG